VVADHQKGQGNPEKKQAEIGVEREEGEAEKSLDALRHGSWSLMTDCDRQYGADSGNNGKLGSPRPHEVGICEA
jgi:hypothetical protein